MSHRTFFNITNAQKDALPNSQWIRWKQSSTRRINCMKYTMSQSGKICTSWPDLTKSSAAVIGQYRNFDLQVGQAYKAHHSWTDFDFF